MRLLDFPGPRSSHRTYSSRRGNCFCFRYVIVIALIFGELSASSVVPLIALPLALVGFLDDRIDLSPLARYCFQLFTSLVLILRHPISYAGLFLFDFTSIMVALSLAALAILVTAVINFTNFMDGLMVCSPVVWQSLLLFGDCLDALPLWVLVGSLLVSCFGIGAPPRCLWRMVVPSGAVFAGLVLHAQLASCLRLLTCCYSSP